MKKICILFFSLLLVISLRAQNQSFAKLDRQYQVSLVPQPTGVSCWATSIAMLLWWRDGNNVDPTQVADDLAYWVQFFNEDVGGLEKDDRFPFQYYGMKVEDPLCYTVEGMYNLLDDYGPLWVALDACYPDDTCAHALVVTGMFGDGTPDGTILYINDPDDGSGSYPNSGKQYNLTYSAFAAKLEQLGADDLMDSAPQDYYIAHF